MTANKTVDGFKARWGRSAFVLMFVAVCLVWSSVASADATLTPGAFAAATSLSTTQAGAAVDVSAGFELALGDSNGVPFLPEDPKTVKVELPAGLIGDATAVPTCRQVVTIGANCPADSQVGLVWLKVMFGPNVVQAPTPLYNLVPAKGQTARLGTQFGPQYFDIHVRSDGDYGLTTTVGDMPSPFPIVGARVDIWGIPADPSHDSQRLGCGGCSGVGPRHAFLRNSPTCGPQAPARLSVTTWQQPNHTLMDEAPLPDLTGCEKLPPVQPTASIQPADRSAGSPSGYDIDLDVPQVDNPDAVATPPLKRVSIDFPNGTAISPGSADGLGACTDGQLHQHDTSPVECPDASKIGTVSITTPYLADPLEGSMYLGQPQLGDQFRLFLVADGSGVSVRQIGSAVPDPETGHLVATFGDLPPIAFSHLHVHMKGGSRAVLVNPTSCGTATSTTTVVPYGSGADASDASSFNVGGACGPSSFSPALSAGTTNPVAGADSPFVLQLRRDDGQQDLRSVAVDLPAGLIGKVAGLPLCPSPQAATGTCGDGSKVGTVQVTVGTGPNPMTLPGSVYMTEGYRGGPFGLDFVVPAKVGPFDFGDVNVRAGIQVDPFSGALHVQTDPMPSIIAGISLHYRALTVTLDRPGFMRNPTSCRETQITSLLTSTSGAVATPSTRFQVAGCTGLPLNPKIRAVFNDAKEKGKRGKPGFSFSMSQAPGQSNLDRVAVTLPKQVGVSLGLPDPCTVAQFEARTCSQASRVGDSWVTTPLLDGRLQGGVYLVASAVAGQFPRLGILLDGQVPISLLSKVTIGHGHLTTTFQAPDLPISTFKLALRPGTALSNAESLCKHKPQGRVVILGASGTRYRKTITVPAQGCPYGKHRKGKAARKVHHAEPMVDARSSPND